MGGLVKSHESGLSVPDWPNTYGEFMFSFPYSKWVGGIFYEHLHRLFASFVGFFPVEDPKYLILVIVDSPTRSIWGSSVAGPIFRNIALDIINYFNIMPN